MKRIDKVLILIALIGLLLTTALFGLVDFTVVDTWDLGSRALGCPIPLGGNRFVTKGVHSLDVYEGSATSVEKVQSLFSADMLAGLCIDGNRLYSATQYAGVHIYQIQNDQTLAYLGEMPLQPGLGGEDYSYFIWASGNILVSSMMSVNFFTNEIIGYYFDVYDISNFTAPQLLTRHPFQALNVITGIFPVDGGYYLCGIEDTVFFTPSLLSFQESNMLTDHDTSRLLRTSFWYMGKLHCIKTAPNLVQVERYSVLDDHHLSPDWTIAIPQISHLYWFLVESGRVSIFGPTHDSGVLLFSYIPSEGAWTQEYVRPWLIGGILKLDNGYLVVGNGQASYYDQQLNLVNTLFEDQIGRFIGMIASRWMVHRGNGEFGAQPIRFYDLVNRQWLDYQGIKGEIMSRYRKDADYLCFTDGNLAQLVRFTNDGTCQSTIFVMPSFCYGMDVWGDRMAITHVINNQYVLKIYDISSGTPVEIASRLLGHEITRDLLFYDLNHLVVARNQGYSPTLYFFKINPDETLSAITNFNMVDYNYLYVADNRILTGRAEAAVIDISNPDQPFLSMYTDPMNAGGWGGGYTSYDGGNNYLFSDSAFWPSYITDNNFQIRDIFISEYSWYRSPNRIILQSTDCLLEVEHFHYVDIDDPVTPELVNPLGLPYPNPFRESMKVDIDIQKSGTAKVDIYNIKGQKVRSLENASLAKGKHSLQWDGRCDQGNRVASGVYVLRLQIGSENYVRKLVRIGG